VKVHRLCAAEHGRSRREAFSGLGGLHASARWHTRGVRIVYAAQSLSLAALETLVHLKSTGDVADFASFVAEIPDKLIARPSRYPARWKTSRSVSRNFGDAWLSAAKTPALLVPSAVSPDEWNVLLNPTHPDFSLDWVVRGPSKYFFEDRLLSD
jgi:RES domain-containing protein